MSQDPQAQMDQTVLEMIEHSPVGAVPHTPTYQDALRHLYATHQVYASADHKDGHVTARSLAGLPLFHAGGLEALRADEAAWAGLEADEAVFTRYVQSLPPGLRDAAESHRRRVAGRPVHHRKHAHAGAEAPVVRDPRHTLFLVPGSGPRHGLPGNYLHGSLGEVLRPDAAPTWVVQLHDSDDGAAVFEAAGLADALAKLDEVLASAPFHLGEIEALGFRMV